jgi:NTP pyrophosphatase (non-canonical NTP hydrolase)
MGWDARSVIIRGNIESPINNPIPPREHVMDIQALQLALRDFAAARHWQPFHTPKNLSTALMVEAAELAEIFQWMTPEESQAAHHVTVVKEHIADEVADVLLYLLQLAEHCAIDLPQAVANKLAKNAIKHPIAPLN